MLALRKLEKVAGSLELQNAAVPEPGPGQVVLKIAACGVCGSDLHAYNQDPGYEFVVAPVTLGHEFAGTVTAVGAGVDGWAPGMRATVLAIQYCGHCPACRRGQDYLCETRKVQGLHYDGGMAEYVKVDARFLVRLPDDLDLQAAALVEPLSVALHCVADRTAIAPGDLAVVTGPGIIGMLCALVARIRGARVVVAGAAPDVAVRLKVARELGFETAVVGEKSLVSQLPRQADVLIEASGAAGALAGSFECIRRGGNLTVVAMYAQPVNWFMTTAVREEFTIHCSYASGYPNFIQAIELIRTGQIPVDSVVRQYALADGKAAFVDALEKRVMKPVLIP